MKEQEKMYNPDMYHSSFRKKSKRKENEEAKNRENVDSAARKKKQAMR